MKNYLIILFGILVLISCKKTTNDSPSPNPPPPPPPPPLSRVPVLITNPATDITLFALTLGGKLTDTGSSKVTELGLVADTIPSPTITRNVNKFIRQPNSNGDFSTIVINTPANKTWYVRAYGINSQGTGYGNEIIFNTLPEKVYVGNVTLTNQQQVVSFGANNYTTIRGSLYINGGVTDLSPLSSLVIIGNGCEIINTPLTSLTGLNNIEIIGTDFIHSFRLERNHSLTNLTGLTKLKIVNGNFLIYNNDGLVNLTGLNNFTTSANSEFAIDGCDNITSITGLERMLNIYGRITLKDNPLLNDLRAWSNLEIVLDRINIINNASLQRIECFDKVKKSTGLWITDNPMLFDISGFRNMDTITEVINLDNNDALIDLSAFNRITTIEYLSLKNNAQIPNLEGFKNLQTLKRFLTIDNNAALINLQGLRRLRTLNRIEISRNNSLVNINGLDSLTSIRENAYSVFVGGNPLLQNLDGLKKVLVAEGSVQISTNATLANFCGLKPLFVAGYSGFFFVENNAVNPTQSQVVSNCQ